MFDLVGEVGGTATEQRDTLCSGVGQRSAGPLDQHPVADAGRGGHTAVPEPDDVRRAVAVEIGEEAGVEILAGPTSGGSAGAEPGEDELGVREPAGPIAVRRVNPTVAEPDQVGMAV